MIDMDETTQSPPDSYIASMDIDENTPPLADLRKWQEELYGDLPDDILQASIPKYDFRPAARVANRFVTITWMDQDESGNYDPDGKREPSPLRFHRKRRERPDNSNDGMPKKPKTDTWQHGRFNGCQMVVTFKILSEHGLAWQKAVGTASDNWPQAARKHFYWSNSGDESSSDDILHGMAPYGFRKRTRRGLPKAAHFNRCELPDLADITLGHPAARGCKGCFAKGEDCPLLDEGSRYPCTFCQGDDIDCDLILEPSVKRACEPCGRRRAVCSYREQRSDHTKPCVPCLTAGVKCVAGPLSGRTRVGPSLDQGYRTRKKGCTQCSRARKWCSLKNKNPSLPCTHCRQNGEECSFEPLRRQVARVKTRPKHKAAVSKRKAVSEAVTGFGAKRFMTITTKLAHSILFNYMSEQDDDPMPCHWCDDPIYGLLGLGEVEVEVMDNGDGQGFTEVVDRHTAAGYAPSRMCGFCTLDRLRITACKVHDIEPIEGMDPAKFDYGSITDWMMPGAAASAPFLWCSICPAPAFFTCCSEMEGIDAFGEGDQKGCGLLLCESCAVTMVNEHDGNLEGLLDRLKDDEEDGGFGLRADADLLHPKGELLRRMAAG